MNEIALSNDLNIITSEIMQYGTTINISYWEVGRRLRHVKENDLTHGNFMNYLEQIKISYTDANKLMKISTLPNIVSLQTLPKTNLFLISSLPEEERAKEHVTETGEVKTPDEMTTRELQRLNKRINSQLDIINQKNDTINKQAEEVRKLKQLEPKVVRETVEKAPDDYEQLKENNAALSRELERAEYEAKTVREAYDSLLKKRQEEDEGSRKYKEMTEAINEMEGQMTRQQKRIQSQKQVYELVDKSKDLLQAITPIPYLINAEFVNENPVAKRELENIVDQTGRFLEHLNNVLKKTLIIEGEIIND